MRTVKEFVKYLSDAGYDPVELKALSLKELKALYKKERAEQKDKKDAPVAGAFEGVSSSRTGRPDSCDVFNMKTASYVRTYSKEAHGQRYAELAKEFCQKNKDCFIKE